MSNTQASCAGNGAASFTTNIRTGMEAGDTITVSWSNVVAGCEQQTVAVAGYDTGYDHFEADEVQALIDAGRSVQLGHGGTLTWTVPDGTHPNCHVQLDVVTGPVHPVIDGAHRYNKPFFHLPGGNDLITDGYANDATCGAEPATTTAPPTTGTSALPPATKITVVFEDPLPPEMTTTTLQSPTPSSTTSAPVDQGTPGPTPPGPGVPTLYTAQCETSTGRPCDEFATTVTGAPTTILVLGALVLCGLGALGQAAAAKRKARA